MIIATLASVLFLVLNIQITKCFALSKIDTEVIKKLLTFSIPLMPNAMMWWVVNASNRYFILFFIGTSVNGLFAVANKIPSLLSIIQSIFFQAWQMSAIEEFDSGDKSKFYSNIFEIFSVIMIIGTSFILVILKRIMYYLVAPNFFSSWELVPFLLMGILFSSFSSFLGTNYIAAKKTKGVLKTSLVGAIVNVVCCFIFIPWIGANGAGIATMISFFSIWIIRYFDTKKFIKMEINFKKLLINSTIIFTQIFILYNTTINKFETFFEIALFVLLIFMNREVFCIIVNKITKK
ncbi:lipopolysaccharide biosynthesis protein [Carnobacterium maltaromaticum]|nr:polysaccharide biosynthesis C-terminal domain-containing protein [Carnobacterium maltaromaticum]MDT1944026.1 polysaccharide biosynthesis C-terminal domain-containing protein [Carnobacterium maltaromaticum]MDT1999406.1 polysaccharide biosynthesis C-terminal domain-containing protein [Carnobacterium maltaromaticum]